MAVTVVPDIASLHGLVGKELGASEWVEITQERIDLFAEATGDRQWIHVDPERARRESPFGGPVAHGHLTLCLAPMFLSQIVEVENSSFMVNPGFDRMRLRTPVRPGDRIRMRATLAGVRDIPGGAVRAKMRITFDVEGARRPAAFGDALVVYYP